MITYHPEKEKHFDAYFNNLMDGVRHSPNLVKNIKDNKGLIHDAFFAGVWQGLELVLKQDNPNQ